MFAIKAQKRAEGSADQGLANDGFRNIPPFFASTMNVIDCSCCCHVHVTTYEIPAASDAFQWLAAGSSSQRGATSASPVQGVVGGEGEEISDTWRPLLLIPAHEDPSCMGMVVGRDKRRGPDAQAAGGHAGHAACDARVLLLHVSAAGITCTARKHLPSNVTWTTTAPASHISPAYHASHAGMRGTGDVPSADASSTNLASSAAADDDTCGSGGATHRGEEQACEQASGSDPPMAHAWADFLLLDGYLLALTTRGFVHIWSTAAGGNLLAIVCICDGRPGTHASAATAHARGGRRSQGHADPGVVAAATAFSSQLEAGATHRHGRQFVAMCHSVGHGRRGDPLVAIVDDEDVAYLMPAGWLAGGQLAMLAAMSSSPLLTSLSSHAPGSLQPADGSINPDGGQHQAPVFTCLCRLRWHALASAALMVGDKSGGGKQACARRYRNGGGAAGDAIGGDLADARMASASCRRCGCVAADNQCSLGPHRMSLWPADGEEGRNAVSEPVYASPLFGLLGHNQLLGRYRQGRVPTNGATCQGVPRELLMPARRLGPTPPASLAGAQAECGGGARVLRDEAMLASGGGFSLGPRLPPRLALSSGVLMSTHVYCHLQGATSQPVGGARPAKGDCDERDDSRGSSTPRGGTGLAPGASFPDILAALHRVGREPSSHGDQDGDADGSSSGAGKRAPGCAMEVTFRQVYAAGCPCHAPSGRQDRYGTCDNGAGVMRVATVDDAGTTASCHQLQHLAPGTWVPVWEQGRLLALHAHGLDAVHPPDAVSLQAACMAGSVSQAAAAARCHRSHPGAGTAGLSLSGPSLLFHALVDGSGPSIFAAAGRGRGLRGLHRLPRAKGSASSFSAGSSDSTAQEWGGADASGQGSVAAPVLAAMVVRLHSGCLWWLVDVGRAAEAMRVFLLALITQRRQKGVAHDYVGRLTSLGIRIALSAIQAMASDSNQPTATSGKSSALRRPLPADDAGSLVHYLQVLRRLHHQACPSAAKVAQGPAAPNTGPDGSLASVGVRQRDGEGRQPASRGQGASGGLSAGPEREWHPSSARGMVRRWGEGTGAVASRNNSATAVELSVSAAARRGDAGGNELGDASREPFTGIYPASIWPTLADALAHDRLSLATLFVMQGGGRPKYRELCALRAATKGSGPAGDGGLTDGGRQRDLGREPPVRAVAEDLRGGARCLVYAYLCTGHTERALRAMRSLSENPGATLRDIARGSLRRDVRHAALSLLEQLGAVDPAVAAALPLMQQLEEAFASDSYEGSLGRLRAHHQPMISQQSAHHGPRGASNPMSDTLMSSDNNETSQGTHPALSSAGELSGVVLGPYTQLPEYYRFWEGLSTHEPLWRPEAEDSHEQRGTDKAPLRGRETLAGHGSGVAADSSQGKSRGWLQTAAGLWGRATAAAPPADVRPPTGNMLGDGDTGQLSAAAAGAVPGEIRSDAFGGYLCLPMAWVQRMMAQQGEPWPVARMLAERAAADNYVVRPWAPAHAQLPQTAAREGAAPWPTFLPDATNALWPPLFVALWRHDWRFVQSSLLAPSSATLFVPTDVFLSDTVEEARRVILLDKPRASTLGDDASTQAGGAATGPDGWGRMDGSDPDGSDTDGRLGHEDALTVTPARRRAATSKNAVEPVAGVQASPARLDAGEVHALDDTGPPPLVHMPGAVSRPVPGALQLRMGCQVARLCSRLMLVLVTDALASRGIFLATEGAVTPGRHPGGDGAPYLGGAGEGGHASGSGEGRGQGEGVPLCVSFHDAMMQLAAVNRLLRCVCGYPCRRGDASSRGDVCQPPLSRPSSLEKQSLQAGHVGDLMLSPSTDLTPSHAGNTRRLVGAGCGPEASPSSALLSHSTEFRSMALRHCRRHGVPSLASLLMEGWAWGRAAAGSEHTHPELALLHVADSCHWLRWLLRSCMPGKGNALQASLANAEWLFDQTGHGVGEEAWEAEREADIEKEAMRATVSGSQDGGDSVSACGASYAAIAAATRGMLLRGRPLMALATLMHAPQPAEVYLLGAGRAGAGYLMPAAGTAGATRGVHGPQSKSMTTTRDMERLELLRRGLAHFPTLRGALEEAVLHPSRRQLSGLLHGVDTWQQLESGEANRSPAAPPADVLAELGATWSEEGLCWEPRDFLRWRWALFASAQRDIGIEDSLPSHVPGALRRLLHAATRGRPSTSDAAPCSALAAGLEQPPSAQAEHTSTRGTGNATALPVRSKQGGGLPLTPGGGWAAAPWAKEVQALVADRECELWGAIQRSFFVAMGTESQRGLEFYLSKGRPLEALMCFITERWQQWQARRGAAQDDGPPSSHQGVTGDRASHEPGHDPAEAAAAVLTLLDQATTAPGSSAHTRGKGHPSDVEGSPRDVAGTEAAAGSNAGQGIGPGALGHGTGEGVAGRLDWYQLIWGDATAVEKLRITVTSLALTHFADTAIVAACLSLLDLLALPASALRVDVEVLRRIASARRRRRSRSTTPPPAPMQASSTCSLATAAATGQGGAPASASANMPTARLRGVASGSGAATDSQGAHPVVSNRLSRQPSFGGHPFWDDIGQLCRYLCDAAGDDDISGRGGDVGAREGVVARAGEGGDAFAGVRASTGTVPGADLRHKLSSKKGLLHVQMELERATLDALEYDDGDGDDSDEDDKENEREQTRASDGRRGPGDEECWHKVLGQVGQGKGTSRASRHRAARSDKVTPGGESREQRRRRVLTERWKLVTDFCHVHGLPPSRAYLAMLARRCDWVELLAEAQKEAYPRLPLLALVNAEVPSTNLKSHLGLLLRGLRSAEGAGPPPVALLPTTDSNGHAATPVPMVGTGAGPGTTARGATAANAAVASGAAGACAAEDAAPELFSIIALCEREHVPGHALLQHASQLRWPLLAVAAASFSDVTPEQCLVTWLDASWRAEAGGMAGTSEVPNAGDPVDRHMSMQSAPITDVKHRPEPGARHSRGQQPAGADACHQEKDTCAAHVAGGGCIATGGLLPGEVVDAAGAEHVLAHWLASLCAAGAFLLVLRGLGLFLPQSPFGDLVRAVQASVQQRPLDASAHMLAFGTLLRQQGLFGAQRSLSMTRDGMPVGERGPVSRWIGGRGAPSAPAHMRPPGHTSGADVAGGSRGNAGDGPGPHHAPPPPHMHPQPQAHPMPPALPAAVLEREGPGAARDGLPLEARTPPGLASGISPRRATQGEAAGTSQDAGGQPTPSMAFATRAGHRVEDASAAARASSTPKHAKGGPPAVPPPGTPPYPPPAVSSSHTPPTASSTPSSATSLQIADVAGLDGRTAPTPSPDVHPPALHTATTMTPANTATMMAMRAHAAWEPTASVGPHEAAPAHAAAPPSLWVPGVAQAVLDSALQHPQASLLAQRRLLDRVCEAGLCGCGAAAGASISHGSRGDPSSSASHGPSVSGSGKATPGMGRRLRVPWGSTGGGDGYAPRSATQGGPAHPVSGAPWHDKAGAGGSGAMERGRGMVAAGPPPDHPSSASASYPDGLHAPWDAATLAKYGRLHLAAKLLFTDSLPRPGSGGVPYAADQPRGHASGPREGASACGGASSPPSASRHTPHAGSSPLPFVGSAAGLAPHAGGGKDLQDVKRLSSLASRCGRAGIWVGAHRMLRALVASERWEDARAWARMCDEDPLARARLVPAQVDARKPMEPGAGAEGQGLGPEGRGLGPDGQAGAADGQGLRVGRPGPAAGRAGADDHEDDEEDSWQLADGAHVLAVPGQGGAEDLLSVTGYLAHCHAHGCGDVSGGMHVVAGASGHVPLLALVTQAQAHAQVSLAREFLWHDSEQRREVWAQCHLLFHDHAHPHALASDFFLGWACRLVDELPCEELRELVLRARGWLERPEAGTQGHAWETGSHRTGIEGRERGVADGHPTAVPHEHKTPHEAYEPQHRHTHAHKHPHLHQPVPHDQHAECAGVTAAATDPMRALLERMDVCADLLMSRQGARVAFLPITCLMACVRHSDPGHSDCGHSDHDHSDRGGASSDGAAGSVSMATATTAPLAGAGKATAPVPSTPPADKASAHAAKPAAAGPHAQTLAARAGASSHGRKDNVSLGEGPWSSAQAGKWGTDASCAGMFADASSRPLSCLDGQGTAAMAQSSCPIDIDASLDKAVGALLEDNNFHMALRVAAWVRHGWQQHRGEGSGGGDSPELTKKPAGPAAPPGGKQGETLAGAPAQSGLAAGGSTPGMPPELLICQATLAVARWHPSTPHTSPPRTSPPHTSTAHGAMSSPHPAATGAAASSAAVTPTKGVPLSALFSEESGTAGTALPGSSASTPGMAGARSQSVATQGGREVASASVPPGGHAVTSLKSLQAAVVTAGKATCATAAPTRVRLDQLPFWSVLPAKVHTILRQQCGGDTLETPAVERCLAPAATPLMAYSDHGYYASGGNTNAATAQAHGRHQASQERAKVPPLDVAAQQLAVLAMLASACRPGHGRSLCERMLVVFRVTTVLLGRPFHLFSLNTSDNATEVLQDLLEAVSTGVAGPRHAHYLPLASAFVALNGIKPLGVARALANAYLKGLLLAHAGRRGGEGNADAAVATAGGTSTTKRGGTGGASAGAGASGNIVPAYTSRPIHGGPLGSANKGANLGLASGTSVATASAPVASRAMASSSTVTTAKHSSASEPGRHHPTGQGPSADTLGAGDATMGSEGTAASTAASGAAASLSLPSSATADDDVIVAPLGFSEQDFATWADALCPAHKPLLGHALLRRVLLQGQPLPSAVEVELILLASRYYVASGCLDGTDVVFTLAASRSEALVAGKQWRTLVRLAVALGGFRPLRFLFDELLRHGQLERLLMQCVCRGGRGMGEASAAMPLMSPSPLASRTAPPMSHAATMTAQTSACGTPSVAGVATACSHWPPHTADASSQRALSSAVLQAVHRAMPGDLDALTMAFLRFGREREMAGAYRDRAVTLLAKHWPTAPQGRAGHAHGQGVEDRGEEGKRAQQGGGVQGSFGGYMAGSRGRDPVGRMFSRGSIVLAPDGSPRAHPSVATGGASANNRSSSSSSARGNDLVAALRCLVAAAEGYLSVDCAGAAGRCLARASLVALQLRHHHNGSHGNNGADQEGEEWETVGLGYLEAEEFLRRHGDCAEAVVVARAYGIRDWAVPLWNQVLVGGNWEYWLQFSQRLPLRPSWVVKLVHLYRRLLRPDSTTPAISTVGTPMSSASELAWTEGAVVPGLAFEAAELGQALMGVRAGQRELEGVRRQLRAVLSSTSNRWLAQRLGRHAELWELAAQCRR
eukprot:jgi/Mesvir1/22742/Mv14144-RA.1